MKSPQKSCPGLFRLIERAQVDHLVAFLSQGMFGKSWLQKYKLHSDEPNVRERAFSILADQNKDRLRPLELEAARVINVEEARGQFALEGLAQTKLQVEELATFKDQKDDLARSIWIYLNHKMLFEAVEGVVHTKLYRQYGKHNETFRLDGPDEGGSKKIDVPALIREIEASLDRGTGAQVHEFDFPGDADDPPRKMYLIYHPKPFASARDLNEEGEQSTIYFRPPGEAMIIHTPSRGTLEVRATSRQVRQQIARAFATEGLESNCPQFRSRREITTCPVSFRGFIWTFQTWRLRQCDRPRLSGWISV